jgi:hypothetical protein
VRQMAANCSVTCRRFADSTASLFGFTCPQRLSLRLFDLRTAVELPARRRAVKVLIRMCAPCAEGLFNEVIDPGVDVRFGVGRDFRLGPPEAYRDGAPCTRRGVPHIARTYISFGGWHPNPHRSCAGSAPLALPGGSRKGLSVNDLRRQFFLLHSSVCLLSSPFPFRAGPALRRCCPGAVLEGMQCGPEEARVFRCGCCILEG